MRSLILAISHHGHLNLIKQYHNDYTINSKIDSTNQLQAQYDVNTFHYAITSNNTELLDYLIEVVGMPLNEHTALKSAFDARAWKMMKHFITKYKVDIGLIDFPLHRAAQARDITLDIIDYIITTFNLNSNDINNHIPTHGSPLNSFATNSNIIAMKHLIEKYNANPHCLYDEYNGTCNSLLHVVLRSPMMSSIKSSQLFETVKYLCELGLDMNQINTTGHTPIELLVYSRLFTESRLSIFKLLLEYKAVIRNVDSFIQFVSHPTYSSISQHLIEIYEPSIDVKSIQLSSKKTPFFHYVIESHSSTEFISYLISLNTIDINKPDNSGCTPILHAMASRHLHGDIIKLFIQNGANFTIVDWLMMFGKFSSGCNPYQLFQCLDYFNDEFGFNIETFSPTHYQLPSTPLFQFVYNKINFRYSTIKRTKFNFNLIIIYRALIHHYKANVNDLSKFNKNSTVFHHLAQYNHYELIQFTLLHSHYKPNINIVNNHGETFLHILVSNFDEWFINEVDESDRKSDQQSIRYDLDGIAEIDEDDYKLIIIDDEINDRYHNFEKVLDCIVGLS